jgi:7-cyano-7-deazaguanine synthase
MDSAALVRFCLSQGKDAIATHVQYGQRPARRELRASRSLVKRFGISLRTITFEGSTRAGIGLIPGRNAFLVFAAIMDNPGFTGRIALGIHAGSPYYDCSPAFLRVIDQLVAEYSDGRVRVTAPFIDWSKQEIFDYCLAYDVPVETTYSCEAGNKPCRVCPSCLDLEALRARTNELANS